MKALGWNPKDESAKGNYFPKCLIIYPDPDTRFKWEKGDDIVEKDEEKMIEMIGGFPKNEILCEGSHYKEIPGFKDFYKIAVPLPELSKER